jgi:hypothetical protein
MRKSPASGALPSAELDPYWQPVLLVPQASATPSPKPLRAMLVDGTAAIETIASPVAISFFVFDI